MSHDWRKLSVKFQCALILLSVLFLGSCSATKKATSESRQAESKTEQHTELNREIRTDSTAASSSRDVLHDVLNTSTTTEQVSDEEITTTVREYDTDKPTDAATGTPPLKREITQSRRKADAGRQTQTTGQTTDQQRETAGQVNKQQTDKTDLQENSQQQDNAAAQVETTEKRGLNTWQRVLCTLGGLVILGALVWLGWKLKRYL